TERQLNPAASSPAKITASSSQSTLLGSASLCTQMVQLSSERGMAPEKHEGRRRVKSMILRSRLLKRMRPNEPWRLSVDALALNFTTRVKLHFPPPPYPRPQKTVAPLFLDFLVTIGVSEVHLSLAKKLPAPITPQRKPNRFRQRCPPWRQLGSIK